MNSKELVKVNITVEISRGSSLILERELKEHKHLKLIDYKVLPDTEELYNNNTHFRKIMSEYKKIKEKRDEYINNYNK